MNMPAMRNGIKLAAAGGGLYRGNGQVLMAGRWDATVTVTRGGQPRDQTTAGGCTVKPLPRPVTERKAMRNTAAERTSEAATGARGWGPAHRVKQ